MQTLREEYQGVHNSRELPTMVETQKPRELYYSNMSRNKSRWSDNSYCRAGNRIVTHQDLSTTRQLTPLCQAHYRHVHRQLHPMYEHLKCFTCNARLKGPIRHCPNSVAIKQHFSRCGDIDICITDEDTICTNCYNAHLQILHESQETSTDDELNALLQNSTPGEDKYPSYIAQALQKVLAKVGNVLLKNLAVLLPEVYQLFVTEALNRAVQLGLDQSESVVKHDMPKQCVLSILVSYFGKHSL